MDWEITEDDWQRIRRKLLCVKLQMNFSIPDDALYDLAIENGVDEVTAKDICGF